MLYQTSCSIRYYVVMTRVVVHLPFLSRDTATACCVIERHFCHWSLFDAPKMRSHLVRSLLLRSGITVSHHTSKDPDWRGPSFRNILEVDIFLYLGVKRHN